MPGARGPARRLLALRRLAGLALVGATLLLGVACGGGDDRNEAGRLVVNGRAEVGAPGEDVTVVRGSAPVDFGQRASVREGTAVIRLTGEGDRQLELRVGSTVELASADGPGPKRVQPAVVAGDVLATTGGAELPLTAGDVSIVVRGAAQVASGQPIVVTTYTGSAVVSLAGKTVTVPALRQVEVPASGPVPDAPSPAAYDAQDPWDVRYLGDAIALGNELDARSQGFSAQVGPTDGRTADFYRQLLDPLADEPAFTTASLSTTRAPGETLVGAAIVAQGTMGPFDERWTEVFAFRDQGAPWGVVALDQGVARAPLIAMVDDAIGRGPSLIATPGGSAGSAGSGGSGNGSGIALPRPPGGGNGSGSSSGGGAGGSGGSGGASPPAGSPTTTTTVPPGSPPLGRKGPLNTGVGPIDDLVNALVDTLSGLLRGLGGG
jgi:hypothetical protein